MSSNSPKHTTRLLPDTAHDARRAADLTTAEYWDRSLAIADVAKDAWYRKLARRHFDEFFRRILYASKAAPRVLELGCAPGRMLCRLHGIRRNCHFEGIDFAPDGVQATERTLQRHGVHAPIHTGDMRFVQLPNPFDVVVSFGLIEHFEDPAEVLRHHVRFCRPGGCVAVTLPNFSPWLIQHLAQWCAPDVAATHNFQIMNECMLEVAMHAAGLENVEVGSFGGPRVWMAANRRRWFGRLYRRLAMAWNFAASLIPGEILWQGTYWAKGVAPG